MAKITELSQLDPGSHYSYADYLTWQLDRTVELIKGKVMAMTPAPSLVHKRISRNLLLAVGLYLKDKPCQIFNAPFDVKLYGANRSKPEDRDVYTVVQPDLCVICDPGKLTEQGCDGAPDWIVEILSKGNSRKDMHIKYALYAENGVTEYWLVYPYEQAIYQFVLDPEPQRYRLHGMFAGDDRAAPFLFPELHIDLTDVFAET
ncbi:MAG: Uma2 family endonuclease [Gammaproteobacteria bacterium]